MFNSGPATILGGWLPGRRVEHYQVPLCRAFLLVSGAFGRGDCNVGRQVGGAIAEIKSLEIAGMAPAGNSLRVLWVEANDRSETAGETAFGDGAGEFCSCSVVPSMIAVTVAVVSQSCDPHHPPLPHPEPQPPPPHESDDHWASSAAALGGGAAPEEAAPEEEACAAIIAWVSKSIFCICILFCSCISSILFFIRS